MTETSEITLSQSSKTQITEWNGQIPNDLKEKVATGANGGKTYNLCQARENI